MPKKLQYPPTKKWVVRTMPIKLDEFIQPTQEVIVEAHFVFDNSERGEGLCFRSYREQEFPSTYIVALFAPGTWQNFSEIKNG